MTGSSEHDNKSSGPRALKLGPIGCHETSVNKCQSTLSNIAEEGLLSRKLAAMGIEETDVRKLNAVVLSLEC